MRLLALLLAATVVAVVGGELAPPERPYNILVLILVSSKSHRNVFLPVVEAMAQRGHKITILSNLRPALQHDNVVEVTHAVDDFNSENQNMFEGRTDPLQVFWMFRRIMSVMVRKLYHDPSVMEFYAKRKEYDLIMTDHVFNEVGYPFLHEMPFITVSTPPSIDPRQSAVLGNVLTPAYMSTPFSAYNLPMSFSQRVSNLIEMLGFAIRWRITDVVPYIQQEISALFPDLPPLLDIERNQSLTLMNTHFALNLPLPLLPSQVEVGAMHCRPAKPLPDDLDSWISSAGSAGVVYFSLGSVAKGDTMPVVYRDMFVQAFKKLKQRVVWKYEGKLGGISDNVLIGKWLPQQDVLGHPNVRVFISHGGGLSMQESLYHATPILALPIFGDQPKNSQYIQSNGFGLGLLWEDLTIDLIVDSIHELINNPTYRTNVEEASAAAKDRLNPPVDRAVFWTEYVIRHRGAPRLRSPATQLSWVEYLMLDVLLVLQVALYLTYRLARFLVLWFDKISFGN